LGWRAAFLITGLLSLLWLVAWLMLYTLPQRSARVSPRELALIQSDPPDPAERISWFRLLAVRETWAYAIGKFLTDPIWWLFLFWLPDFFAKTYHLDLKHFGPPLVAVYVLSDVGSVAGGWLSSTLIKRGASVNVARKVTMLICAVLVLPIMAATHATTVWAAVGILGLAAAAHQAFSANLLTLPSDVFPRGAVASVVGIGGTLGAIGGMLMAIFVGWILQTFHSYLPTFMVAGSAYLLAYAVIQYLSPKLEPVQIN
jgi:ACS family hexuronate transporter-like MFS transporter